MPGGHGGVRAGWLARDLLTAHLSQLGKQKGTREDAQSTSPTRGSTPKGLWHQQWDPREDPGTEAAVPGPHMNNR